ncbi:hypothetical protein [Stakelama pacifica]|uniref:Uncharacterized protein n=1 Tax=Stakelama pacifica TaxID=517720 RepID=A0A4R6FJY3_9SPHN|nr:hypothetical protein [Stakelama pacifica]TDN81772.1 hypothetical protein EV664_107174 [Stakelama pacifica]GGO96526.1 hypothetical protein GCM10011329_23260 [Stakelama pacifica]
MSDAPDSKIIGELSIGFMMPRDIRRLNRHGLAMRDLPEPISFKMRHWPNGLGDKPTDAIGKLVKLDFEGVGGLFRVVEVSGETLILGNGVPVEAWNDPA